MIILRKILVLACLLSTFDSNILSMSARHAHEQKKKKEFWKDFTSEAVNAARQQNSSNHLVENFTSNDTERKTFEQMQKAVQRREQEEQRNRREVFPSSDIYEKVQRLAKEREENAIFENAFNEAGIRLQTRQEEQHRKEEEERKRREADAFFVTALSLQIITKLVDDQQKTSALFDDAFKPDSDKNEFFYGKISEIFLTGGEPSSYAVMTKPIGGKLFEPLRLYKITSKKLEQKPDKQN